ncbi:ribosome silencing factor [Tepidibacillus decaturensis]|uniref:Ribosomal silencing factor RsfS n=1 Tax=Tepidibacillus decaturensis TaxID=1413211 RepID=A0A135L2M2_9BACI|nr:ribosome silencing factor [Tepidibacillus decaturensis]KXG43149.1 ribosomal silencing factor RsfS [Tepidibacillus decaturensis]
MALSVKEIAELAAQTASNKKAKDVVILDIRGLSVIADYFVICSGNSETQVQAVANEIKDKMHEVGVLVKGSEGMDQARWILIDLGDVVVHIFHKEEREFYHLERLWGDAPRIEFEENTE